MSAGNCSFCAENLLFSLGDCDVAEFTYSLVTVSFPEIIYNSTIYTM